MGEIIHLLFPYMLVGRYTVIRLDLKSLYKLDFVL